MILHICIAFLSGACILTGLLGSVVPVIPGTVLIFAGALLYAWFTDFTVVSGGMVGLLLGLAVLCQVLEYAATLIGARKYGASRWGIAGAVVGGVLGLFGGIVGIIIGPALGAFLFELARGQDVRGALKSGMGAVVGFLGGSLGRVAIALSMTVLFVVSIFW